MSKGGTAILKKDMIKLVGRSRLGPGGGPRAGAAGARIVSQEDGCVTIEVSCGCGQKTLLKCTHGQAAAAAAAAEGAGPAEDAEEQ